MSLMVTLPLAAPTLVALNVTLMVQLAPTAMLPTQLSVSPRDPLEPAFVVTAIRVIESVAVPELLSVTVWAALVVPTSSGAKATLLVESVTAGAGAAVIAKGELVAPVSPVALAASV